jgi:GTPase SAR1 family protein
MFTKQLVNNIKVRPVTTGLGDDGKYRVCGLFPVKFPNIPNLAFIGPKGSGKTSLTFETIKRSVDRNTVVVFFVSTLHNDASYEFILEWLQEREIATVKYTSIFGPNKTNRLERWIKKIEGGNDDDKTSDESDLSDSKEEVKRKGRKQKYVPLPYIFIFDDIGEELNNKYVSALIKKNRHLGVLPIFSSQNLKDVAPQARRNNIDYYCLFPRLSESILDTVWEETALAQKFKDFLAMYKDATEGNGHGFLYMSTRGNDFRKNLNEKYIFSKDKNATQTKAK